MGRDDDAEQLRDDDAAWEDESTRGEEPGNIGNLCMVAQTIQVKKYPTVAASCYACQPVTIFGTEVEGQPGGFAQGPGQVFAFNLGGTVPPQGTFVIITFIDSRWVFRYG